MLKGLSHYMAYSLFGMEPGSTFADAAEFFIHDIIKIFLLLSAIIFVVSVKRSYFPPERTKRILSHKKEFIGYILAARKAASESGYGKRINEDGGAGKLLSLRRGDLGV